MQIKFIFKLSLDCFCCFACVIVDLNLLFTVASSYLKKLPLIKHCSKNLITTFCYIIKNTKRKSNSFFFVLN